VRSAAADAAVKIAEGVLGRAAGGKSDFVAAGIAKVRALGR
jgi:hypothetical protein